MSSPPAVQACVPRGPRQIKQGSYRTRRQSRRAAVLKAVVHNNPPPAAVNKWNYVVGKLVCVESGDSPLFSDSRCNAAAAAECKTGPAVWIKTIQTNYPTYNFQQRQGDKPAVDGEREGKPDQVSTGLVVLQIGLGIKTTF